MNESSGFNEEDKVRIVSRNTKYLSASVRGGQTPRPTPLWIIEARQRFLEQRKQSIPRTQNPDTGEEEREV